MVDYEAHLKPALCFMHSSTDQLSFLFVLAARVLEDCGAERQPRGGALWEGGHQYTWQWFPHRKIRAIFKVSSSWTLKHTHLQYSACVARPVNRTVTGMSYLASVFDGIPGKDLEMTIFSYLFLRHGWNLTVLPNNSGSILRHLGAVPGKDM